MVKLNTYSKTPFYLNNILVDPLKNIIQAPEFTAQIQPKNMEVLCYFCSHPDRVISPDELIEVCWPNQFINDSPVHKSIAQLRKSLKDNARHPIFIKTVSKRGYLLIAQVNQTPQVEARPIAYWSDKCPYPGLLPYAESQQALFFGRTQLVSELTSRLLGQDKFEVTWLNVYGPMGIGKSSFIQAGLIAGIRRQIEDSDVKNSRLYSIDLASFSREKPAYELTQSLNRNALLEMTYENGVKHNSSSLKEKIENMSYASLITSLESGLIRFGGNQSLAILFIDHLDEIFLQANDYEVKLLVGILDLLASSSQIVLITALGSQFIDDLRGQSMQYVNALSFPLPGFNTRELLEIIEKPVKISGLVFEYSQQKRQDLGTLISQDYQNTGVPISSLQIAFNKLFNQRKNRTLTFACYDSFGGIEGCYVTLIESRYENLSRDDKDTFESLLFLLITVGDLENKVSLAEPVLVSNLSPIVPKVSLLRFAQAGLIRIRNVDKNPNVQLSNSLLLTHWGFVKRWVEKNKPELFLRHDLQLYAKRWTDHDQSKSYLQHSLTTLQKMRELEKKYPFTFQVPEKAYLLASKEKLSYIRRFNKFIVSAFIALFVALAGVTYSVQQHKDRLLRANYNAENLLSFILVDLQKKLQPLGQIELLKMVGDKTIEYFEVAGTENLSGKSLEQWVQAIHLLGQVQIEKQNFAEAEFYFQQSDKAINDHMTDSRSTSLIALRMLTQYWIGYIRFANSRYAETTKYWEQYLNDAELLVELNPENTDWVLEKSYALNNLGALSERTNKLLVANQYFGRSAKIKQTLLLQQPGNVVILSDLADTNSWQATIFEKLGEHTKAMTLYNKALDQASTIHHQRPNDYLRMMDLAILESRIGHAYYNIHNLEKSKSHLINAQNMLLKLAENDPQNLSFKEELLKVYALTIKILRLEDDTDTIFIYLDKALNLISLFKSKGVIAGGILRLQIIFNIEKSMMLSRLKQLESAIVTINFALTLFDNEYSFGEEANLYSQIMLARASILKKVDMFTHSESGKFERAKQSLLSELSKDEMQYFDLAIYLMMLQEEQSLTSANKWLEIYRQSDYRLPEFDSSDIR